jgi:PucR family transcriptional regulator, purine catabolism regulatory protein
MSHIEPDEVRAVEQLTSEALAQLRAGRGLRGVVAAAAATLALPVVLVSRRRRVVAAAGLADGEDPLTLVRAAPLAVPVQVRGIPWGGLSVAGDPPPPAAAAVLARAAELVELELLHSSEPVEAEQRAQRELFADLLAGRTAAPLAAARAGLLGRALGEPRPLLALAASAAPFAEHDVDAALEEAGAVGMWARLDEELLVLGAASERERTAETAAAVAEALARRAARADGGALVAVAAPADALEGAGRRLREARDALAVARALGDAPPVVHARDLLVDRVLAQIAAERDLASALEEELAPLRALSPPTAAVLLRTLQAHLDAGGSKTLAAQRLAVRRQTLYRRLERIERLVGSLDDPERRLTLQLAVRSARLTATPARRAPRRRR